MTIRILITDDHQLFREGIANLLAASTQIEIVAQAENGQQAIEKARKLKERLQEVTEVYRKFSLLIAIEFLEAVHPSR